MSNKATYVFNYSLLRGLIKQKFNSEREFALSINTSPTYLSNVFNGKAKLRQDLIATIAKSLDIPDEDIGIYFFAKKVVNYPTL